MQRRQGRGANFQSITMPKTNVIRYPYIRMYIPYRNLNLSNSVQNGFRSCRNAILADTTAGNQ